MTKRLTLSISQIAPLIGLDNYNNFPRIFCEIWRKYNPDDFRTLELKLKTENNQQLANSNEMNDIWEIDEQYNTNLLEQVKTLNDNKNKSSTEMVKIQNNIISYINDNNEFNELQKKELAVKICSITNKNHGVCNEDAILNEFCKLTNKELQKTQGWVEIPLNETDTIKWVVIGKYDGITMENELVEAKMRQKCLFKKMRDYENIQVQLYLHALGFEQGFLVESCSNSKGNQLYIHELEYNKEYVEDFILARLKKFTIYFNDIINDEESKIMILKGDRDRFIYNNYKDKYLD